MNANCNNLICWETGLNVGGKMRNVFVVRFTVALNIHGANHSTENTIIVIKHFHHKTRSLIVPLFTTAIVLADKYTLCTGLSITGINTNHHDGQKLPQTSMRRWPYNKSFCSLVLLLCHLHKNRIQHHYETFLQRSHYDAFQKLLHHCWFGR